MIDETFGKILRKLRLRQHLSQEELSFNTHLHRTYISQLERGLKSPSLRTIHALCQELHISLSDFMMLIECCQKQSPCQNRD
jgi:transcriptional regulator with XRE-family HTH domain